MTQKIKTPKRLTEVLNPKAKSEKKFKDKHVTIKHKDPAGNGDDVFQATNIKTSPRMADNHGYDTGGHDEKVYEDVENLSELTVKSKSILKNIGYKLMYDQSQKNAAKRVYNDVKNMKDGELVRLHHGSKSRNPDRGTPGHFQARALDREVKKRKISATDYEAHRTGKYRSISQKNESKVSDYKMIPTVVNGKVIFKKIKKDVVVEDMNSNTIHVQHLTGKVNGKKFKVPTHVDAPHDEKHIAKHNVHLNPKDVKIVAHHLKKLLEEKECGSKKKKKELKESIGVQPTNPKKEFYNSETGKVEPSKMKKSHLSDAARELINHANNMDHLKRAQRPFIENARRRMHKGTYDSDKGQKLWHHYAKHVVTSYHAEYMPHENLKRSMPNYKEDIKQVAAHFEKKHRYAIQNGLHESVAWYSELTEENKDNFDSLLESSNGLTKILEFIDKLESLSESGDEHLAHGKKYKLPVKSLKNSIGSKQTFLIHQGDHVDLEKIMNKAGFKKVQGGTTSDHATETKFQHSDGTHATVGQSSYDKVGRRSIRFKKG
jgi:hypothetical protein